MDGTPSSAAPLHAADKQSSLWSSAPWRELVSDVAAEPLHQLLGSGSGWHGLASQLAQPETWLPALLTLAASALYEPDCQLQVDLSQSMLGPSLVSGLCAACGYLLGSIPDPASLGSADPSGGVDPQPVQAAAAAKSALIAQMGSLLDSICIAAASSLDGQRQDSMKLSACLSVQDAAAECTALAAVAGDALCKLLAAAASLSVPPQHLVLPSSVQLLLTHADETTTVDIVQSALHPAFADSELLVHALPPALASSHGIAAAAGVLSQTLHSMESCWARRAWTLLLGLLDLCGAILP
jgi:hypothetical protein